MRVEIPSHTDQLSVQKVAKAKALSEIGFPSSWEDTIPMKHGAFFAPKAKPKIIHLSTRSCTIGSFLLY